MNLIKKNLNVLYSVFKRVIFTDFNAEFFGFKAYHFFFQKMSDFFMYTCGIYYPTFFPIINLLIYVLKKYVTSIDIN